MKNSRRNVLVFCSLFGTLSLTSMLLLILRPAPIAPDSVSGLFATEAPVQNSRWNAIFIHHSRTQGGDAAALSHTLGLADHFVIGNGQGLADGQIQVGQQWDVQQPASLPGLRMESGCISICVIGDLDRSAPTAEQARRLTELVTALQARFQIPAKHILLLDQPNAPAGMGRHFPLATLRQQWRP